MRMIPGVKYKQIRLVGIVGGWGRDSWGDAATYQFSTFIDIIMDSFVHHIFTALTAFRFLFKRALIGQILLL